MSESIDLLKSIDASLKAILAGLKQGAATAAPVARQPVNPFSPQASTPAASNVPRVASDADLDGQWGDPVVRAKSPRDWTGPNMMGKKFSECDPGYLDLVADRLDYFAGVNESSLEPDAAKKARYNRLDASRARGWAARLRAGYKPTHPAAVDGEFGEVPF